MNFWRVCQGENLPRSTKVVPKFLNFLGRKRINLEQCSILSEWGPKALYFGKLNPVVVYGIHKHTALL